MSSQRLDKTALDLKDSKINFWVWGYIYDIYMYHVYHGGAFPLLACFRIRVSFIQIVILILYFFILQRHDETDQPYL
jgi:hypothetical protein